MKTAIDLPDDVLHCAKIVVAQRRTILKEDETPSHPFCFMLSVDTGHGRNQPQPDLGGETGL